MERIKIWALVKKYSFLLPAASKFKDAFSNIFIEAFIFPRYLVL